MPPRRSGQTLVNSSKDPTAFTVDKPLIKREREKEKKRKSKETQSRNVAVSLSIFFHHFLSTVLLFVPPGSSAQRLQG
jgi:hypothetical protein